MDSFNKKPKEIEDTSFVNVYIIIYIISFPFFISMYIEIVYIVCLIKF